MNLISDFAVLLLPIAGVSQLRMETRKKAAVSAVFGTGLVYAALSLFSTAQIANCSSASAISALRLYYSTREARSDDKSYWLAVVGLCGTVEIAMVILCGCFTSFPGFLRWARGERGGSHQWYKSRGYASESRSRLRSNAVVELGKIEVTCETKITNEPTEDWRIVR